MTRYLHISFTFFALVLSGCVFISEPDVGASSTGPEFGESSEMDDSRNPPGSAPDPSNMEVGAGGEGGSSNEVGGDASIPSEDAGSSQDEDASMNEDDADTNEDDAAMETNGDAGLSPDDATVSPQNDMGADAQADATIEVPRDDCSDVEWDCSRNGYCDPIDRPECALDPGFGACYGFSTVDETEPEAYARCCAEAGSCNQGRFCEPEPAEFSYCWLTGNGSSCYIDANPISQFICDDNQSTRP